MARTGFTHQEGWLDEDPVISDTLKAMLTQYSHLPEQDLIPHIRAIRDLAWKTFKYPCFGRYGFCKVTVSTHAQYGAVLERLKAGDTMLELGCGMGQDMRKFIFDGAPAEYISGADLQGPFIEYGHQLFNDGDSLPSRFYIGDVFAPETMGMNGTTFDLIHASYFFHLFNYEEQLIAVANAVRLLKAKPGSMIFGWQYGQVEPASTVQGFSRSGEAFGHSPESWTQLVAQVEKDTGIPLRVEAQWGEYYAWLGPGFRWLQWSITRV